MRRDGDSGNGKSDDGREMHLIDCLGLNYSSDLEY